MHIPAYIAIIILNLLQQRFVNIIKKITNCIINGIFIPLQNLEIDTVLPVLQIQDHSSTGLTKAATWKIYIIIFIGVTGLIVDQVL